jgi:hypothetical protein
MAEGLKKAVAKDLGLTFFIPANGFFDEINQFGDFRGCACH